MQEEHISNDLHHDRLARCSDNAITCASSQQTLVACSESLPDIGEDDQEAEEDTDRSPAEDVAQRDNQNVGESERNHIKTCEKRESLLAEMKLMSKEREHWSNGKCGANENPNVQELGESRDDFPQSAPVQRVARISRRMWNEAVDISIRAIDKTERIAQRTLNPCWRLRRVRNAHPLHLSSPLSPG